MIVSKLLIFSSCFAFASIVHGVFVPEASFITENRQFAVNNGPHNLSEAIAMINMIMDKLSEQESLPSLVFGISVRNKTIHSRAIGLVDIENFVPAKLIIETHMTSIVHGVFVPEASFITENRQFAVNNGPHNLSEAIAITNVIMDKLSEQESLPSLVFGISVRNKTIHSRAIGLVDIENFVPAKLNAMYRMASVTKTFTSTMIGTLVDAGKLSFDDSIYKHLPPGSFPPKIIDGKQVDITVGQVLSHMAGLHQTDLYDFFNITFPKTSLDSLKIHRGDPLYFLPGSNWIYSNYGYQLLGAIIENKTGNSYPDSMNEFIKNTLKLSDGTQIEKYDTMVKNHLRPRYYRQNESDIHQNIPVGVFDDALFSTGVWAAGGLLSNVDDLLAYGNLLLDSYHSRPNAILKKETLQEIWKPRTEKVNFPIRPTNEYGYGWSIAHVPEKVNPNIRHRDFNWHSGGLIGSTTFMIVYPKEEIVAVAMTNKGLMRNLDTLAIDAAELIYDFVPKQ